MSGSLCLPFDHDLLPSVENHEELFPINNGVTELFVANVDPEHESAFRNWTARIHQLEANFPGFRGVFSAISTGRA